MSRLTRITRTIGVILATVSTIAALTLLLASCHSDPCWAHGGTKFMANKIFYCNDGTNTVSNGLGG
jgi:hypothetical protein